MSTREAPARQDFTTREGRALSDEQARELIAKARAVSGIEDPFFERLYRFLKRYFDLQIVGLENIPKRPTLFVGNHCTFGLDGWLVTPALYFEEGRFVRSMADAIWLQSESAANRLIANGLIPADPRVCDAMMEDGCDLLVFPGGAWETIKPASEKYTLKWKERYGFVRMAARHGYTITPFATVGPDDLYEHALEAGELPDSRLGKLLRAVGVLKEDTREDLMQPVPLGLFNTILPRPQRCYLAVGEPLAVRRYGAKPVPQRELVRVRTETAARIEALIRDMLLLRAQRRHEEGWLRRLLTR